jgi:hypothetical protein
MIEEKKTLLQLFAQNVNIIIGGLIAIFFIVSNIWLLSLGYLQGITSQIISYYTDYFSSLNDFGKAMIGNGIAVDDTFVLSMFSSYGILGASIIIFVTAYIIYSHFRNVLKTKKSSFLLIAVLSLIFWMLVSNINVTMLVLFWILIGMIIVVDRKTDLGLLDAKVLDYKRIKDKQKRKYIMYTRTVLIIVVAVVTLLFVYALDQLLRQGVFFD